MDKAVLASINPHWCDLIARGIKTGEIRKRAPKKIKPPYKVYLYQTLPKYVDRNERDGRVIGYAICDRITNHAYPHYLVAEDIEETLRGTYVKFDALMGYLGVTYDTPHDDKKWEYSILHLRDATIYDTPKHITDFKRWNRTEENAPCAHVPSLYGDCKDCKECNLTRPPQSWCYVEELEGCNDG